MIDSDRELLELAAKAAGYSVRTDLTYDRGIVINDGIIWNPLCNDSDALRLAIRCLNFYTLQYSSEDWEYCGRDGYAATRRAIVKAAAEIGRRLV